MFERSRSCAEYDEATIAKGHARVWQLTALALIVVSLVNAGLLLVAAQDRSWLAWGIAMLWGPVANGVLSMFSLLCLSRVIAAAQGARVLPYVLAAILLPLVAIVADILIIASLGVHGC